MSEQEKEEQQSMMDLAEKFFGGANDGKVSDDADETQEVEADEPEAELPAEDNPQSDQEAKESARDEKWDKRMQRHDQLLATLEREIQKLSQNPTEKQVERVEKAKENLQESKSKLDKYLDSKDVDPYEGVTDIASEVKADRGRFERLLQEHEAMKREMEERESRREAEIAQMRFAMNYPSLTGRYTEFAQKAHEKVVERMGDAMQGLSQAAYLQLANESFNELVEQASSEAQKEEVKPQGGAKKPKGSRIIKTNSGNSGKPDSDDPDAEMAKIRASWGP